MGIYLKGAKVVADNTQLDVSNWAFISAVDYVMEYCFDNIGTALKYPERFNVVSIKYTLWQKNIIKLLSFNILSGNFI